MKVRWPFAAAMSLLWLVVACGGDGNDGAENDVGGGLGGAVASPSSSDASTGDLGSPAAEGEITLVVDGVTLTSKISECEIRADGSITIVSQRGDPDIGLMATPIGNGWAISVAVMVDGHVRYQGDGGDHGTTVDGQHIALTMDFDRVETNSLEGVGVGHLNATCPSSSVSADPGEPVEPNTIRIGERVWTRTTSSSSSSCFLREEGQGISEGAAVGDAADGNEETRIHVSLDDGKAAATVSGSTYRWMAGSGSGGPDDLQMELDFDTQTIQGSGTFTNVGRGETAQGSFAFTCDS